MPQLSDRFGPIPYQVVLDASGNGTVTFQPNGKNARVTTLFVKASSSVLQATVTLYKGQVSDSNVVGSTVSGSTGAPAFGNIDLFDGETLYVVWRGGDVGATATATFVGQTIPFSEVGGSEIRWSDPIAANDGTLIFPAIKSSNFVTNVAGWSLDRAGNAEFNNVAIRGTLRVDGSGISYLSAATEAGTPKLFFQPDTIAGAVYGNTGFIEGLVATSAPSLEHVSAIELASPRWDPQTSFDASFLELRSESDGHTVPASIWMYTENVNNKIQVNILGSLRFDRIDCGKGWRNGVDTNASSAAIGNVETTVLTLPAFDYEANRAFKIDFTGLVSASVANNLPTFRMRKSNPAGQRFTNGAIPCINTSPTTGDFSAMFTVGAATVTATLVLTLQGSAAFNATMFGSATTTTSLDVYDIGLASAHPNVPVLV